MAKNKDSGYTAVHALVYLDELEGTSVVSPGESVPAGVLGQEATDRLLKKGAIKKTKDVQAEAASEPAAPEVKAVKDPVAAAASEAAASAPGPSTARSSR